MTNFSKTHPGLLLAILLCGFAADGVLAQTAPVPRAVVPAQSAPEALSGIFSDLSSGSEQVVEIAGAEWLQLQFADYNLGANGTLTITGPDGDSQTFNQEQLAAWEGLTGIFNGSRLTVTLAPGEGETATASIGEVIIGLPATVGTESPEAAAPQALQSLFGSNLRQFIPPPPEREPFPTPPEEGAAPPTDAVIETICGGNDDRTSSNHPFSGRIMPIGCTGWIIEGGAILTAGHCISSSTQTLEFNVPPSDSDGTTNSPLIQHQYRVISSSIVDGYTGVGNDWAVFQVLPNTQTGQTPIQAQGGGFEISQTANPSSVTITGYGVDGPPPRFGAWPPPTDPDDPWRNADNQTHQTHSGTLVSHVVNGPTNAVIRYSVDTQGGNSGSPVFGAGDIAIGIHTNGGCHSGGGSNAGTSLRNDALWAAIDAIPERVLSLALSDPGRRLGKNDTMGVSASLNENGTPVSGATVNFRTADTNLLSVSPPSSTTSASGVAQATIRGETSWTRTTTTLTASEGATEPDSKGVLVPDLSFAGFVVMIMGIGLVLVLTVRREGSA